MEEEQNYSDSAPVGDTGLESVASGHAEVETSGDAMSATPTMTTTTATTSSATTSTPSTTLNDAHLEAVKVHMSAMVDRARQQNGGAHHCLHPDVQEKPQNKEAAVLDDGRCPAGARDPGVPPSFEGPSHVFTPSWSTLSREEVVDKVKGTIYGQAIGDAIGLCTECMAKAEAKEVYGQGPVGYARTYVDFHRSRWDEGDWTEDTDQMLLVLQSIVDNGGRAERLDFARRLNDWMIFGFPELGDVGGMGIGPTVHRTLNQAQFLSSPHEAAREMWERSGRYLATNEAIMRTSVLGVVNFNDLDKIVSNTIEISATTHADPRCTASCVAMTTALSLMLQGKYDPMKEEDNKALVEQALEYAFKHLSLDEQQEELRQHVMSSSLEDLKLDEQSSIGYTFKALGAGFYGLRKATDFRETIMKLIMEGGDADTNGAVCGALMGCKFGFKGLPQDLLQFKHRQWLDDKVDSLLRLMGLN